MRPTRSQRRSHSCILFRPRAEQLEPRAMLSIEPTLLAEFSTMDVEQPSIDHFETARDLVFFNVNDSELWVTDGRAEGTVRIADEPMVGEPFEFEFRAPTLFTTRTATGHSVWRTDGTVEGTWKIIEEGRFNEILHDRHPNIYVHVKSPSAVWRFDRDIREAELLVELPSSSAPKLEEESANRFYIVGRALYATDGTAAGTVLLREGIMRQILVQSSLATFTIARNEGQREIVRILGDELEAIELPAELQDVPLVATTKGIAFQGPLTEDGLQPLYFHDGVELTQFFTADPSRGFGLLVFRVFGERLVFWHRVESHRTALISSDGTRQGTVPLLTTFDAGWSGSNLATDGVALLRCCPFGVWRTDGTVRGTAPLPLYQHIVHTHDGLAYGMDRDASTLLSYDGTTNTYVVYGGHGSQFIDRGDHLLFIGRTMQYYWIVDGNEATQLGSNFRFNVPDTARVGDVLYGSAGLSRFRHDTGIFRRAEAGKAVTLFQFPAGETIDMLTDNKPKDSPLFYRRGTEESTSLWAVDGGFIPQLIRESTADIDAFTYTPTGLFFSVTNASTTELWASDGTTAGTKIIEVDGFDNFRQLRAVADKTFFVADPKDGTLQLWNAEPAFSVDAGPGYLLPEGESLQLMPVVSNAIGPVIFDWDLDGDGQFDDYTSDSASHTAPWDVVRRHTGTRGAWPIAVRATDTTAGSVVTDSSSLFIKNKWPSYEPLVVPDYLNADEPWEFRLDAFDVDELTYSVDFGDGNGPVEQSSPDFVHNWERAGRYHIVVRIDDGEIRNTSVQRFDVEVLPAGEEPLWLLEPRHSFGGFEPTVRLYDGEWGVFELTEEGQVFEVPQFPGHRLESAWLIQDRGYTLLEIANIRGAVRLGSSSSTEYILDDAVAAVDSRAYFRPNIRSQSTQAREYRLEMRLSRISDLVLADFDGDEDLDLYVASDTTRSGVFFGDYVFLHSNSATAGDQHRFGERQQLAPYATTIAEPIDIENDGDIDIVVHTASPDSIRFWLNDGNGVFSESEYSFASNAQQITVADLDGDADSDLVLVDEGNARFWINDGIGVFAEAPTPNWDGNVLHVASGDLNLDGRTDLFLSRDAGFANEIWLNAGGTQFSDSGARLARESRTPFALLTDRDDDGDLDILVASYGGQNLEYLNTILPERIPPEAIGVSHAIRDNRLASVTVTFSEDVSSSLEAATQVRLLNTSLGINLRLENGEWNASDNSVTWNLVEHNVGAGSYRVTLPRRADITDAAGNDMRRNLRETIIVPQEGDLNLDGEVALDDFLILSRNFNRHGIVKWTPIIGPRASDR